MNQVRIYGDPFGEDGAASLLRSFLRFSLGSGMQCALSLSAVSVRPPANGEREVALTDGVRALRTGTLLPPAEIDLLLRAASQAVAATSPVVVFAAVDAAADAHLLAGLEWPQAAVVLVARERTCAAELLVRVRAELRWAGAENSPEALEPAELAPWLALPAPPARGPLVHVGAGDFASGTELLLEAWLRHFAPSGQALRLVLPDAADSVVDALRERAAVGGAVCEIVRSAFAPGHARDAAAIVLPWRRLQAPRVLLQALASGRPVCTTRWGSTAPFVGRSGTCLPIGGRLVPAEGVEAEYLAPHPQALVLAMQQAVGDSASSEAIVRRARQHVVEHWTRGRPAAPPSPMPRLTSGRPTVVLEAPFFETSSSAELSIETARALQRGGAVDLHLVPTVPLHGGLDGLRRRAPELVPLLTRDPGVVDLWLSSGWPVRTTRPACRTLALRVDWEFGALPVELTPHVPQEADCIIVHSEHVRRTIEVAGRATESLHVVPHGVDAAMHEQAPPDPTIVQWKGKRPAVLFCGGLIWRKGFDLFLRAVLAARAAGADFCVVVKTVGHDQHYGRFHLGELLERFLSTPGTPPLLRIERDLSRHELASVYTACDLLLHPYRGEGFGLPVLEARACGLPVLATGGGATDSCMTGPGAVKIPAVRRALELPSAHVSDPWVLEPSAEDTGRLLVQALATLGERRAQAREFAPAVRAAFAWDAAAASIARLAVEARGGRQAALPRPTGEPVVTLPPARRPFASALPDDVEPRLRSSPARS